MWMWPNPWPDSENRSVFAFVSTDSTMDTWPYWPSAVQDPPSFWGTWAPPAHDMMEPGAMTPLCQPRATALSTHIRPSPMELWISL